jgi:hypothetical protein
MSVVVISNAQALREAGWSARADADTNLDRLREWHIITGTYEYARRKADLDEAEAVRLASAAGMSRVSMISLG